MMMRFVLIGGPADGHKGEFGQSDLAFHDGPPAEMLATYGLPSEAVGRYVRIRRLTPSMALIYEWRPAPSAVRHDGTGGTKWR
jgi:hypothetical protein